MACNWSEPTPILASIMFVTIAGGDGESKAKNHFGWKKVLAQIPKKKIPHFELTTRTGRVVRPHTSKTVQPLAAATSAAATAASVATTVSGHDAAAEAAAGSVPEIDQAGERVGGVNGAGASSRFPVLSSQRRCGAVYVFDLRRLRDGGRRAQSEILEQHLLLAGQESQLEPAEDVVHDRLGVADVGITAPATRLKSRVRELLAEQFQRHAVLQRDRDREREAVH